MAFIAAQNDPTLDQGKCIKLALVHDLAESIVRPARASDAYQDARLLA